MTISDINTLCRAYHDSPGDELAHQICTVVAPQVRRLVVAQLDILAITSWSQYSLSLTPDELLNHILIKCLKRLERFGLRGDANSLFRSFVRRATRYRILDVIREDGKTFHLRNEGDSFSDSKTEPSMLDERPEQHLLTGEIFELCLAVVRKMKPVHRQLFLLIVEGNTVLEIAEAIKKTPAATRQTIFYVRERLRTVLAREVPELAYAFAK